MPETNQNHTAADKPYGTVYLRQCTVNGKGYVGQTTRGVEVRWAEVLRHLRTNPGHQPILDNAILKHGANAFETRVLAYADTQIELDSLERHYIASLGTLTPNGYNAHEGGFGGPMTEEAKEKISKKALKRAASSEYRAKLRKSQQASRLRLFPQISKCELLEFFRDGLTMKEIRKRTGISKARLCRETVRHFGTNPIPARLGLGLECPQGSMHAHIAKEPLESYIREGLELPELAAKFGLKSVKAIRTRIKRYWGTTVRQLRKDWDIS